MTKSKSNPYRGIHSRKEIDLRDELNRTLYGASDEIAKGRIGLLRQMRRDSSGNLVQCPCRSDITTEPDRDHFCRYCHSHGYYWDEYRIVYFKNDETFKRSSGNIEEYKSNMFYFEYYGNIYNEDFIVEVKVDKEGIPEVPIKRLKVYDIISADELRAENGRTEFWQVRAEENREWSVWYGVKPRN